MCDAFFSPKWSKYARYFSQKIYNAHAIFCQFSDIKNGGRFKQPSVLGQLVTSELAELAVLRKANLIFQWISLSNATLFSIIFFACGVHWLIIYLITL